MAASNLGRVQGGGFFGSTSASTTSIEKTTVQTNGVSPLVGDTVVNANGDLCRITAITEGAYTVTKYGSVKGTKGDKGADYEKPEGGIPQTDLSEEVQALLGNDATARAAAEAAANAAEKAQNTANGKQDKLTFDSTPTAGSENPVTSGGVKSALEGKYTKPSTGISKADLATDVQASLGKADNAVPLTQLPSLLLEKVYPVGSIYISIKDESPASFLGGTWTKLPAGHALWLETNSGGTILSGGLPNIKGLMIFIKHDAGDPIFRSDEKLFTTEEATEEEWSSLSNNAGRTNIPTRITFDASKYNAVYGNTSGTTVRPSSYTVIAWKRIS